MLDIRFIRENADLVQDHAQKKGYTIDIADLLHHDENRRSLQQRADALREKRNALSSQLKGQPSPEVIAEVKALKEELGALEAEFNTCDAHYQDLINQVPNILAPDVPIGGEEDSVEIKQWGEQNTGAIDHLDFATKRDWVDFERGAKVAGAKFYFLKGDLALLENAITQYALHFVKEKDSRS